MFVNHKQASDTDTDLWTDSESLNELLNIFKTQIKLLLIEFL